MRFAPEILLSILPCCIAHAQAPIVDARTSGAGGTAAAVAERTAPTAEPGDPVLRLAQSPSPSLKQTQTLREALQQIARKAGVPVQGLWRPGDGADSLDPDRPVSIEVPVRTCAEALDLLGDLLSREGEPVLWQASRMGVEFGRRSSLWRNSALQVRVYDTRDLLLLKPAFLSAGVPTPGSASSGGVGGGNGSGGGASTGTSVDPDADARKAAHQDDLVTLIQLTVEPEAWDPRGGPCTIVPRDGLLVIRAPDYVHRRIESPVPAPRPRRRTGEATTPAAGPRKP